MTFANGTKAQDEAASSIWRASLVGMTHNTRIEQRRRFERVLVKEIRTDQVALCFCQHSMRFQCIFHLSGTRREDLKQVSMATLEVVQHILQLLLGGARLKFEHPADNMIGPRLVGRIEIPGLGGGLEGPHHYSSGVRTQMQRLPVQEYG